MGSKRVGIVAVSLSLAIVSAGAVAWSVDKQSVTKGKAAGQPANDLFAPQPKDVIELKVPTPTSFHSGVDIIAQKYGFFAREGIKLKYVGALDTPSLQIAALKAGQIDVLGGHPDIFINVIKGGFKVKGVVRSSLGNETYPHMSFFVRKDSGINSAKDLIGRKVAPGEGKAGSFDTSCGGFFWSRYLKENGIPRDKLVQVPLAEPQQEQALRQGLIDVSANGPTFAGNYLKRGEFKRLFTSWDLFDTVTDKEDSEISFRGFTEDFIAKNPETVRRFVRAIVKANAWTLDHHLLSSEYVGQLQDFESSVTAEHHLAASGLIEDRPLKLWLAHFEEIGTLKPGQLRPTDLYTNEFNPFTAANSGKKYPSFFDGKLKTKKKG
ncbi:MAG: ABC transporter substrate-binding protein [Desulfuromonadaceae bacterium]